MKLNDIRFNLVQIDDMLPCLYSTVMFDSKLIGGDSLIVYGINGIDGMPGCVAGLMKDVTFGGYSGMILAKKPFEMDEVDAYVPHSICEIKPCSIDEFLHTSDMELKELADAAWYAQDFYMTISEGSTIALTKEIDLKAALIYLMQNDFLLDNSDDMEQTFIDYVRKNGGVTASTKMDLKIDIYPKKNPDFYAYF